MLKISSSEKEYLLAGIGQNIRADGRGRLDYRGITIETGVLSQSNGSARVSLTADSSTDLLVSVKAQIGPIPNSPSAAISSHHNNTRNRSPVDQGFVSTTVSCCPSVSAKLEGRAAEEMNVELTRMVNRLLCSCSNIDLDGLTIVPNKSCWIISIDVMVFNSGGNLPDLISVGVYAALNDTIIPAINLVGVEGEDQTIDVDSDPAKGRHLQADNLPICVTLSSIGRHFITDATLSEEFCMTAQVSVSIDPSGNICGIQKSGINCLDTREMQEMVDAARNTSKALFTQLKQVLNDQVTRDVEDEEYEEKVGFFG